MLVRPALLALALAAGSSSAQITFTRIGLPPGFEPQNPAFSEAYGVSDTGVVVGSMYVPNVGFRSFRWTSSTGLVQVDGILPESGIFARAISPDGTIIVGENTGPQVGFRITGSNAPESLGIPNDIDYDGSSAIDLSDNGQAIAGVLSRIEDGTLRMARWTQADGWADLGVLSGDYESTGGTISADGSIVAGNSVGNVFTAVRWTQANGLEALPNPFGISGNTAAIAMSASGDKIVGQANDGAGRSQAAVWRGDGTTQILARTAAFDSAAAFGISASGDVIGGTQFLDQIGDDSAAFWTADGTVYDLKQFLLSQNVDVLEWTLQAITEVSPNGRYLVGRGFNPNGALEAFIVDIPALPQGCDTIDFNNNGVFPEDQDVIDFFDVLAGGECAACSDIDFNNNGVFPEDQDVIDFFNVLAGGTCS